MSSAKTFNFDSVGETLPTLREHESARSVVRKVNWGPSMPLQISPSPTEMFIMNNDFGKQVSDNLRNLLLTNKGERVMSPDFGANLKPILSEFGKTTFETEAATRIKTSVLKYLPYVSLTELKLEELPQQNGSNLRVIKIGITYSVPSTNIKQQQLTVTLNTVG